MKKLIILIFVFSAMISSAQIDLESILEGGVDDAQTFLKGYIQPVSRGFGNGVNGGWYSTAKPHKFLGFDIAVIANAAFVPTTAKTFTFNNDDYSFIKLYEGNQTSVQLPTIAGSQDLADRPLLEFSDVNGNTIVSSTIPGSGFEDEIGYNVVPSAMIQIGVGLFKNTDVKLRFIPKLSEPEFEFSTFGIGVMHDLKQWIPFVKKLPFDVSALLAWNDVKSKVFLDSSNAPSQALEMNTKTFLFQILASKKLSIFTLYGGLGTSSYDADINVLGTFEPSLGGSILEDPININYKGSSMRANLGLSMKLLFLNLSADYSLQEYNVFSVTAGFSVR